MQLGTLIKEWWDLLKDMGLFLRLIRAKIRSRYSLILGYCPNTRTAALIRAKDISHTNIFGMLLCNFKNSDIQNTRKFADWSSESTLYMDNWNPSDTTKEYKSIWLERLFPGRSIKFNRKRKTVKKIVQKSSRSYYLLILLFCFDLIPTEYMQFFCI